ncbi:MAG: hypothetical protein NVS3B20_01860 [Polyangiales bacterium]
MGSPEEPEGTSGEAAAAESIDSLHAVMVLAHEAGLPCSALPMAVAIAKMESSLNPNATHFNPVPRGCARSVDRGLWQINSCWHPEVSDACAYDSACNAKAMVSVSAHGTNWTPWTTYSSVGSSLLAATTAAYESGIPGCNGPAALKVPGASPDAHGVSPSPNACYSHTLRRWEPIHACVQSRVDGEWFNCHDSAWYLGKLGCTSLHPLY